MRTSAVKHISSRALARTPHRYHDFKLKAGSLYSYVVTAYNSEGKTSSPVATETTDPSAPAGLMSPRLHATSSSSIKVDWDSPRNPNGVILNYTLSVKPSNSDEEAKVGEQRSCFTRN